jgi:hypothetical protein
MKHVFSTTKSIFKWMKQGKGIIFACHFDTFSHHEKEKKRKKKTYTYNCQDFIKEIQYPQHYQNIS